MKPSRGQKNPVAFFDRNFVNVIGHPAIGDALSEFRRRDQLAKAGVDFGTLIGLGDVPEFGFRLAAKLWSNVRRRMHLERQGFTRVEKLNQEWKARRVLDVAEDLRSMFLPKL